MKQAAKLQDLQLAMMLPGITVNTSPTDFSPIKSLRLRRFDGRQWVRFGEVLSD
jgi:branched-chain amino acid transport system substrate-binding protein